MLSASSVTGSTLWPQKLYKFIPFILGNHITSVMNYVTISFTLDPQFSDILIAELSQIGFDIFLENETGFQASISQSLYEINAIKAITSRYEEIISPMSFTEEEVEKKNWNEEWEKNYDPIVVSDTCIVKASFHKIKKKFQYQIVINPKNVFWNRPP